MNSLDLPGRPAGHPRRRGYVGRGGFVRCRGAARARRLRCRRCDAAALRPRRGRPSRGLVLRRPGYRRRAPGRRDARHRALRAQLRTPLPRGCHRPVRRKLSLGRDADPVRGVQPDGQVRRPAGDGARARGRRAGHRPLRPLASRRGPSGALPSGRRRARPELLPLRHHPGADRLSALSAGRHGQGPGPRDRRRDGACRRRQGRQPGHLLRAGRALFRHHREAEAAQPPRPARSSISTAACWAGTRASCTTRSASAAASASRWASRSMSCISTPSARASWSARARRWKRAASCCAT